MVVDKAQISRATADLEARGFVAARQDPASRRRKLLRLTPSGQDQIAQLENLFGDRQERLISQLQPSSLAGLTEAIDSLSAYLADATAQPEAAPSRRRNRD